MTNQNSELNRKDAKNAKKNPEPEEKPQTNADGGRLGDSMALGGSAESA
jgi:hypothetical protein